MSIRRHRKAWWAFFLAGAMVALTAMAGPDVVRHLGATVKDHHDCALYHWAHGAGAGAPACISAAASLPILGPTAPDVSAAAPDVSTYPTSSRAPPAIA